MSSEESDQPGYTHMSKGTFSDVAAQISMIFEPHHEKGIIEAEAGSNYPDQPARPES